MDIAPSRVRVFCDLATLRDSRHFLTAAAVAGAALRLRCGPSGPSSLYVPMWSGPQRRGERAVGSDPPVCGQLHCGGRRVQHRFLPGAGSAARTAARRTGRPGTADPRRPRSGAGGRLERRGSRSDTTPHPHATGPAARTPDTARSPVRTPPHPQWPIPPAARQPSRPITSAWHTATSHDSSQAVSTPRSIICACPPSMPGPPDGRRSARPRLSLAGTSYAVEDPTIHPRYVTRPAASRDVARCRAAVSPWCSAPVEARRHRTSAQPRLSLRSPRPPTDLLLAQNILAGPGRRGLRSRPPRLRSLPPSEHRRAPS